MGNSWSPADINDINNHGLDVRIIDAQMDRFKKGFPFLHLIEPATIGNGITQLTREKIEQFIMTFDSQRDQNVIIKFVPASGAASRMFKSLLAFHRKNDKPEWNKLKAGAQKNKKGYSEIVRFIEEIENFSFYPLLKSKPSLSKILTDEKYEKYYLILAAVIGPDGLDLSSLPKALIPFHRYGNFSRTALEEHLVEASEYIEGKNGLFNLHFTVSVEHFERIRQLIKDKLGNYFKAPEKCQIAFSHQQPSSDTIAVDANNLPFRNSEGGLVFRPGGHGTLLENLQSIDGDVIFIKNIDNVTVDSLRKTTTEYKKALGGLLIQTRNRIHELLKTAANENNNEFIRHSIELLSEFGFRIPVTVADEDEASQVRFYFDFLNRPIRVCGMVPNQGEPGGGPFWVHSAEGEHSLQIVEASQVDQNDPDQRKIIGESTHFNPVDLVCSTKDYLGNKFKLNEFVDEETGMISTKFQDGRELKALEVPGLWNGSMAGWLTFFVEVPIDTFTPVKTVFDLLRPEHQC